VNKGEYELARKSFLTGWQRDNENVVIPQNIAILNDQYLHNPAEALRHYRFCYNASVKSGDALRATKIQERILQLEKEAPKTPPAKAPAATPGTVGATAAAGKTATTATATKTAAKSATKSAGKTPAKSTARSAGKASSKSATPAKATTATKSGSASKKK
jgi:hypothetical protein